MSCTLHSCMKIIFSGGAPSSNDYVFSYFVFFQASNTLCRKKWSRYILKWYVHRARFVAFMPQDQATVYSRAIVCGCKTLQMYGCHIQTYVNALSEWETLGTFFDFEKINLKVRGLFLYPIAKTSDCIPLF